MKRLITDHDVLTGAVSPPLLLDENTLITPSARDRAVRMGWAVVEAGGRAAVNTAAAAPCGTATPCGRCGSAACSGTCGATCGTGAPAGEALADGVYLVRIEGGRRVSVLPAAGPGVMARALNALPASLRGGS